MYIFSTRCGESTCIVPFKPHEPGRLDLAKRLRTNASVWSKGRGLCVGPATREPPWRNFRGPDTGAVPHLLDQTHAGQDADRAHGVELGEPGCSLRSGPGRMLHQPIQGDVDVHRILCRDRIAAHLAIGQRFKLERLDESVRTHAGGQVVLVA